MHVRIYNSPTDTSPTEERNADAGVAIFPLEIGNDSYGVDETHKVTIPRLSERTIVSVSYTGDEYDSADENTFMYLQLPIDAKTGDIIEVKTSNDLSSPPLYIHQSTTVFVGAGALIATHSFYGNSRCFPGSILRLEALAGPPGGDINAGPMIWAGYQSRSDLG